VLRSRAKFVEKSVVVLHIIANRIIETLQGRYHWFIFVLYYWYITKSDRDKNFFPASIFNTCYNNICSCGTLQWNLIWGCLIYGSLFYLHKSLCWYLLVGMWQGNIWNHVGYSHLNLVNTQSSTEKVFSRVAELSQSNGAGRVCLQVISELHFS